MSGEHGEHYEVCGAMILKTKPHRFVIASCTSVPDAVRIGACLNALDGVTTEAIEAGGCAGTGEGHAMAG